MLRFCLSIGLPDWDSPRNPFPGRSCCTKTPAEAIRHMLAPLRAAGYNHLLAHESGEMYNVEVSARHFAVLYAENDAIAHTNHYLDRAMQAVEDEPDELICTRVRYFRARRLLEQTKQTYSQTLQSILRDHVNYPGFNLQSCDR